MIDALVERRRQWGYPVTGLTRKQAGNTPAVIAVIGVVTPSKKASPGKKRTWRPWW